MRENYKKAFDKLAPKRSDKELLKAVLGKAENTMEKKRIGKKAIIAPVAAALVLTVGTVGAVAALNAEHLKGVFGGNESIAENIHSFVFEDSDEHVKMTVEECLSDGQCTYLTVHYQALDEEGQKWLADKNIIDDSNDYYYSALTIHPIFKEVTDVFYPVSYGVNTQELTEYRTETDRYFCAYFEADSRHYGTEQSRFTYIMSDGVTRETTLDISNNMEEKWFELKAEESPSEYYIPKYLVLSELSFSIYGENTGVYVNNSNPEKGLWSFYSSMTHEQVMADAVHDISFVFADGSEYIPDGYACLCSADAHEYNRYTDINIASGCFTDHIYKDDSFTIALNNPDIDRIVGLQIGDVYYELSAE